MEKLSPTLRRAGGSEHDIDKDFNERAIEISQAYRIDESIPYKNNNKKKN